MELNVLPQVFEYNQHFVAMMNIINASRLNPPESGDKHHIIPRCWFRMNNLPIDNSDANLVLLTKEQHGKIHRLMSFCAKDAQLKRNMVIAAHFMGLPATSLKYTHSDERRKKISEVMKGHTVTDETRRKISETMKGMQRSEETRRKISEAAKNISDETRNKMSEAHKGKKSSFFGKQHTEESRRKLSAAIKGRTWKLINGKRVWFSKEES